MLVLGLDTATRSASIGLVEGERIIGEYNLTVDQVHSKRLMPMIDRLINECNHSIHDVEGIAVSCGPGSFTGLRIGMATAKGLAYALKVPLVGVSTLKALCWNCAPSTGLLCPVVDARMKEFYTALYRWKDGNLEAVVHDTVMSKEDVHDLLDSASGEMIVVADAAVQDALSIQENIHKDVLFAPFSNVFPRGASVAALGHKGLQQDDVDGLLTLQPAYIRRSQAEILYDQKRRHDPS